MKTPGERVKQRREDLNLSQDDVIALLKREGVTLSQQALSQFEDGTTKRTKYTPEIARVLGVRHEWLMSEKGPKESPSRTVAVAGYVGAGGQVVFDDAYARGAGLDDVEMPPGETASVVAVAVQGASMLPVFRDGDVVYYTREPPIPPHELVGELCVVRLRAPDDRVLLKTIRPGTKPKRFTLASLNADDIQDVQIEWAAQVLWIRPSRRPKASSFKRASAR